MTNLESAFHALGDGTRRAIFERVARAPISVAELARDLPVTRPAVSQHLRALKDAGLVTVRTEGTRHIYRIDRSGLAAIRAWFDRFWDDALTAFAAEAARMAEAEKDTP